MVRDAHTKKKHNTAMDNLDIEMAALNELITLQRAKVELLQRMRNNARNEKQFPNDESICDDEAGVELRKSSSTNNGPDKSQNSRGILSAVTNVLNEAIFEKDEFLEEKNSEQDNINAFSSMSDNKDANIASSEETHGEHKGSIFSKKWFLNKDKNNEEQKEERFVDALTRLSRLTTDLANERTYLAWIRTALASARTVVSFLALDGTNQFGRVSAKTCVIGFAVLSLLMMAHGTERYRKIKEILLTKDTPAGFARLSTLPISLSLLGVLALVIIVTSSEKWVN